MTAATDQIPNHGKLSLTGQTLIEKSSQVENIWANRVKETISAAKKLPEPILMNTLPMYIANLAEALTPEFPRPQATGGCNVAKAHGSERFRMTEYNLNQLITEYDLLKDAIIQVLDEDDSLTKNELSVINSSIILAIKGAVTSFSEVQDDLRKTFIATLSHDIRNPIATIKMASGMLVEDFCQNEETLSLYSMILANAEKVDDLLVDILNSSLAANSSRISLHIEPCLINKIVDRSVNQFRLRTQAGILVKGPAVEGFWSVRDLERSLDNLISNAIKYGAKDHPILIEISEVHERLILSVHNAGKAIPKHEQDSIFLPFERSLSARKGPIEGWGLGLPFVQAVAEAHGGSVLVDSSDERGTTFTIDIPKDGTKFQT
ncbi:MAG: HAMP domain-containing histidine kinase [Proteobacteria bacterium]|nr:MAG: HAMP domain-containing histidine kinase [Pseudomonadota bacterium]